MFTYARIWVGVSTTAVMIMLGVVTPAYAAVTPIGQIQGTGEVHTAGRGLMTVQGVVTGVYQNAGQYSGYTIQDEGDGNPATSDAIFIYDTSRKVSVGDRVELTGLVREIVGQTALSPVMRKIVSSNNPLPEPVDLALPLNDAGKERVESMLVRFPATLTIVSSGAHPTFGQVAYANQRLIPATQLADPTAQASPDPVHIAANPEVIVMDDGRDTQWATPFVHPNGQEFSTTNYFRLGDTVGNLTGVMFQAGHYRLLPVTVVHGDYTAVNPRPSVPERMGSLQVGTFDMGMVSDIDGGQERREVKVAATVAELGADIVAVTKLSENHASVDALVGLLIGKGQADWAAVASEQLAQAFLFRSAVVEPAGKLKILAFDDGYSAPALMQTFRHLETGELINVVASNALASRQSSQCRGDADLGDGQGTCNTYRTAAAVKLAAWVATDPTRQGAERTLLVGRLNAFAHETPITALEGQGYSDLIGRYQGADAVVQRDFPAPGYTGYAIHALANAGAAKDVVDTRIWHITADESPALGYHDPFKTTTQQGLYQDNPVASSWADPVLVSLQITAPVVEPSPDPSPEPSPTPSSEPSTEPSVSTSVEPSPEPSSSPSVFPTAALSMPAPDVRSSLLPTGAPLPSITPAPSTPVVPASSSLPSPTGRVTPGLLRPGLPRTGH